MVSSFLTNGNPQLSSIIRTTEKNNKIYIIIQHYEFSPIKIFFDSIEVGLDNYAIDDIKRQVKINRKEDIYSWLEEEFVTKFGSKRQQYILINPLDKDDIGFSIYGKRHIADIKIRERKYSLDKLRKSKANNKLFPVSLVECIVHFKKSEVVEDVSFSSYSELDKINQDSKSYLDLWNEYNNVELARVIEKRLQYGFIKYNSYNKIPNYSNLYSFNINESKDIASIQQISSQKEKIEISSDIPEKNISKDNFENFNSITGSIYEVGKDLILEIDEDQKKNS